MGARGPKPNAEMDERVTTVRRELRAMGFEGGATQIAAVISYDLSKLVSADSVRARLRRIMPKAVVDAQREARRKAVAKLHQKGMPASKIAEMVGCSASTALSDLRAMGIKPRRGRPKGSYRPRKRGRKIRGLGDPVLTKMMRGNMNLGDVIKRLECEDPEKRVALGWNDWNSWRGSYDELAFSPASATVREMLDVCRAALTKGEMHGYKGGTYPVSEHTRCNVAYYGSYGGSDDYLTKHGLEYRLSHSVAV